MCTPEFRVETGMDGHTAAILNELTTLSYRSKSFLDYLFTLLSARKGRVLTINNNNDNNSRSDKRRGE